MANCHVWLFTCPSLPHHKLTFDYPYNIKDLAKLSNIEKSVVITFVQEGLHN